MSLSGSMRERIIRTFGADALGQLLNIGIRLLLVPLFLSTWGAESYGEWLILTALAAWFSLGDFGAQLYFINRLTEDWVSGRKEVFQRVYSTGLFLFLVFSSLLLGLAVLLLSAIPDTIWLYFNTIDNDLAFKILLLMALRFSVSLPVGLLLGLYRAIGLQATSVMYANFILIIQFLFTILALLNNGGMLLLACLEVLPLVILIPILVCDLRKRMPSEFRLIGFSKVDRSIIITAISPSFNFLALQLSTALTIQGSILVFAKTLGPIEVATFSSMRIVANVMSRFIGLISNASWPEITRLASLNDNQRLSKLFRIVLIIILFFGLGYLVLIVNFGETIFRWWLSGNLPYDSAAMFLLGVQVVLSLILTWGGNLLMATNRHEGYSRWYILFNSISLLSAYLGSLKYGMLGGIISLFAVQYFPMLFIVMRYLAANGWVKISYYLAVSSVLCILIVMTASVFIFIL